MEKLGWHSLGTSFDCTCGIRHSLPIQACMIGEDAADALAKFAAERCGHRAFILADVNTARFVDAVRQALEKRGKAVFVHIPSKGEIEATDEKAEEIAALGRDSDFYVAVGAGTLSDLVKSAGNEQHKPVLLYPTAASMNGYTSAIVALKVRGLKRTLPCTPATAVFADPAVAATAPQRMTAAGLADFLSKCSSSADWRAAHILRGEYYCHRPREFNEGIQERLFEHADAIGRGEPSAVRLVLEALLLSGFGMVVAGSSAPASGGEHLISHYIDMKHSLYGIPNDLHGAQVGIGTIYTLGLWERVLSLAPSDVDTETCVKQQLPEEAIRKRIFEDWGETVGAEVMAQWEAKRLTEASLRKEIETFKQRLEELQEKLAEDLQPASRVEAVIRTAGGPTRPEETPTPAHHYEDAKRYARFIRNRFTVLDLAAELAIV